MGNINSFFTSTHHDVQPIVDVGKRRSLSVEKNVAVVVSGIYDDPAVTQFLKGTSGIHVSFPGLKSVKLENLLEIKNPDEFAIYQENSNAHGQDVMREAFFSFLQKRKAELI